MHFTLIASPTSPHQVEHQHALQQGLNALGIPSSFAHRGRGQRLTTHVACWGWRMGAQLRQMGHEVLVMERGYLGDRFKWTSLAWNGLNGRADFGRVPTDDDTRFHNNFSMRPWRETPGDHVLILGQVPGDASLQGRNLVPWYESVAVLAADAYQLPVKFRPHPDLARKGIVQRPRHCGVSDGTLTEALASAHVAITFNSNSGVDAVLAGTPTITMDHGSMAWGVTGHAIGERETPDRGAWAAQLAWKQWRMEEIASGEALKGLFP